MPTITLPFPILVAILPMPSINKVPQEKKQQASIFKEYEPGYLHIDVTYY
jgi:hypothetical protein